ncbi:hypothetical protein Cs7R123_09980 [Catellatospora sp. TT07R-123]|uniref:hypothetical protein n=1 Tax=Catellatospora sp. TT07R-123 TaxID=2733863 RepID=UPI001B27A7E2|nr:hypothetical protein [Catellatospora sp. TT07R-123]GHJ43656.1 hypothetical protein Cs7R123_09980 [Catellatospora sp. TT07R-123]
MSEPTPAPFSPPWPPPPVAPVRSPGRRALLAHGVWEALLAVAALGVTAYVAIGYPSSLALTNLLAIAGTAGLAASAMSLSLRTGTPNLSLGALVVVASTITAQAMTDDTPIVVAALLGVAAATVIGLVSGLVVALLSVPSWAATLGVGAAADAIVLATTEGQMVPATAFDLREGWVWFVLFVLVTLVGGALWLIPGVRSRLSADRGPARITGGWAGFGPGLGAVVGLTGSGLLAGIVGVAMTARLNSSFPVGSGATLTLGALGVALLGGVSLFGRRGGVTGTLFAALLVTGVGQILLLEGAAFWLQLLLYAVAVLLGAAVTRAIESITGPPPQPPSLPAPADPFKVGQVAGQSGE